VTQSPKDVPPEVLGQLGHRVQHALRAFTPDDEKALRAAARTFPRTEFYEVEQTLTSLGIGEALVVTLTESGVPTQPFATRIVPPASRMGPLQPAELQARNAASAQVRKYAQSIDRESAEEVLQGRAAAATAATPPPVTPQAPPPRAEEIRRPARAEKGALEQILKSPVTRTVAGAITRGLMGALFGGSRSRRSRW
jgi:uncharacterized protein